MKKDPCSASVLENQMAAGVFMHLRPLDSVFIYLSSVSRSTRLRKAGCSASLFFDRQWINNCPMDQ